MSTDRQYGFEYDARCTCGWRRSALHEHAAVTRAEKHRTVWSDHPSTHETSVAPIALDQVDPTVPLVGTAFDDFDDMRAALHTIGAALLHAFVLAPARAIQRWRARP